MLGRFCIQPAIDLIVGQSELRILNYQDSSNHYYKCSSFSHPSLYVWLWQHLNLILSWMIDHSACCLQCHTGGEVTWATCALFPTKNVLLCNKALFVGNKTPLSTLFSLILPLQSSIIWYKAHAKSNDAVHSTTNFFHRYRTSRLVTMWTRWPELTTCFSWWFSIV